VIIHGTEDIEGAEEKDVEEGRESVLTIAQKLLMRRLLLQVVAMLERDLRAVGVRIDGTTEVRSERPARP